MSDASCEDLMSFAQAQWGDYQESLSLLSASKTSQGEKNKPIVHIKDKAYDFDSLVKDYFFKDEKVCPKSADALLITEQYILFIEFKSGFKDKINLQNLDPEKVKCKKSGEICSFYWDEFAKRRQKEKECLKYQIELKLLQSFQVLKNCLPAFKKTLPVYFFAVIDSNDHENDLAEAMRATSGYSTRAKVNKADDDASLMPSTALNDFDKSLRRYGKASLASRSCLEKKAYPLPYYDNCLYQQVRVFRCSSFDKKYKAILDEVKQHATTC